MRSLELRAWIFAGIACATATAAAAAATDDRLVFSADGSTLSQGSGGGGGSAGWLHNFSADTLAGAAVEYQTIANAHWTFGSLTASTTSGPAEARLSLYGEVHEGTGDIGTNERIVVLDEIRNPPPQRRIDAQQPVFREVLRRFDYSIVAAGLIRTFGPHFSMQLEDRQVDIDTTHGNLPKLGMTVLWGPRLQTAVSWQHSVSGNLGTNIGSLRIDAYAKPLNWLVGGAFGQATPAVVNLQTGIAQPGSTLREVFVGASKTLARSEVTLVADHLELAGIKRETLTLTYIFDFGAGGHHK
jgi:hypothetical protein